MKKVFSYIIAAGLAVLGVVSCAKKEMVIFDPASGTAPVLTSYTMDDDGVYAEYTPGSFKMGFNEKVAPVHSLALLKAGDKVLSKTLVSKAAEGKLTVTRTELCKALMTLGFAENDKVNISLAVRASLQDQARTMKSGFLPVIRMPVTPSPAPGAWWVPSMAGVPIPTWPCSPTAPFTWPRPLPWPPVTR